MSLETRDQLMKIQREFVGDILTLAEIGLSKEQFRRFKKKVFEAYHERLKPKTAELLTYDRGRASMDRKGGAA